MIIDGATEVSYDQSYAHLINIIASINTKVLHMKIIYGTNSKIKSNG